MQREDTEDRSHCAHTLNTTLTELEEAVVVSLRETLNCKIHRIVNDVYWGKNKHYSLTWR
ncbi:MAG: hypothetical protein D4R63_00145 [Methylococcaceae bacterium]|nr:MAG: hypothetical protein D4R63_00145 [Methylococcaceae bacterium]